jgi:flagellar basal-body rod modification protein FlgD
MKEDRNMAASINGIWSHASNLGAIPSDSQVQTSPADDSGSGSGNEDGSATISANDFLTLLVTEMQNQDPTADTDPNEYIDQLVQVNSLEQLISINQTLTADSTTSAGSQGGADGTQPQVSQTSLKHPANDTPMGSPQSLFGSPLVSQPVSGNLAIPATNAAAQRVAQALGGQINSR